MNEWVKRMFPFRSRRPLDSPRYQMARALAQELLDLVSESEDFRATITGLLIHLKEIHDVDRTCGACERYGTMLQRLLDIGR